MTLLGKILASLNVLAALAFAALLIVDYGTRHRWSYAVFLADVKLQGLPLEKETHDPDIPTDRYPSQFLDEATLKTVFAGAGEPVKTLEEEVQKLQGKLPGQIEAAVADVEARYVAVGDVYDRLATAVKLNSADQHRSIEALRAGEGADFPVVERMLARTLANRIADQRAAERPDVAVGLLAAGREIFPAYASNLEQGTAGALPKTGLAVSDQ